jgi:DNA replication and repair protein RecF
VSQDHSLSIRALSVRGFRNLARVDITLDPFFNVVSGDNAQGKTNLLEAVYVVATSKSFRTSKMSDLVMLGGETATIRAAIDEAGSERLQSVGIGRGIRAVRIDGKRPASLAAYATGTPTVVFHAGALALSSGSGSERRRLLDRICLYLAPSVSHQSQSYAQAQRARQRVLETRGDRATDLDGWEQMMVSHGMAVSAAREAAAASLGPEAEAAFTRIGPAGSLLGVRYRRGAPDDATAFLAELAKGRIRDRAKRSPGVGPHRDELVLELSGRPVRGLASQGQHRAVVLALQLGEIDVVRRARGVRPVLLLDDVSSELDRQRTAALFRELRHEQSQVVLTTTRPDLIEADALSGAVGRRNFRVVDGQVCAM